MIALRVVVRCKAGLLACLAALPLVCAAALTPESSPAPANAASMPTGEGSPIADASADALWWGDFKRLEVQYAAVRNSTDLSDSGTLPLQWFRVGLSRVFGASDESDAYFAQLEAMTHAWSVAHPGSPLAQLLYARALYGRGLHSRGGEYASKTPLAAMDEFQHYLALAETQLAAHADVLSNESTTYTYLAMFGRWHLPYQQMHAVVLAGIKVNPRDLGGFEELATSAVPRFGGSTQRFDGVVREAVRLVDGYDGMALYAFLYDDNSGMFEGDIFDASDVDWPTMRKGFDDYLKRYPEGYLLNRFALQACVAQDKPTTLALFERIGPKPSQRAWGNRLEACRRWARSP